MDISIGEVWLWMFEKIGSIPLGIACWVFNISISVVLIRECPKNCWWFWLGIFCLVVGIPYILVRFALFIL